MIGVHSLDKAARMKGSGIARKPTIDAHHPREDKRVQRDVRALYARILGLTKAERRSETG